MAKSLVSEILEELPHIIVLAFLLFALLFVATRFKWIHCSQIPQWCDVYCQISGHSQVAIISGGPNDTGMGNPLLFSAQVSQSRIFTIMVPFSSDQISSGVLNNYELVVLDHYKQITLKQAITLENYVNQGGSILWMGDAASQFVSSPSDDALALALNRTQPGYYEAYHRALLKINSSSFGPLGNFLGAQYVSEVTTPTTVSLTELLPDHPTVNGIRNGYSFTVPYVTVTEDPTVSTKIAVLSVPGGAQVPAILDRRYVGRIVYVSFPVELANSPTLTQNLMDYLVQC